MKEENHEEGYFLGLEHGSISLSNFFLTLLPRLFGATVLTLYAIWFNLKLIPNLGRFYELELTALQWISSSMAGVVPAAAGAAAFVVETVVVLVLACVLSAIIHYVVLPRWHKTIDRQWKWVKRCRWGVSTWGDVLCFLAWVLLLIESVFFILVFALTAIVLLVNALVLVQLTIITP